VVHGIQSSDAHLLARVSVQVELFRTLLLFRKKGLAVQSFRECVGRPAGGRTAEEA
jgi:hypothetical protein